MRFRGSNDEWEHDEREDEGSVIDVRPVDASPGPFRRLWGRLRRDGRAQQSEPRPEAPRRLGRRRAAAEQPPSYLAAPRALSSPDAAVRHVAQASGGPFVETRLAREIRRLVASLGTTRGEVALTLEQHRVRAEPLGRGPVACFLEAVIGADPNVKSVVVDADSVTAELRAWWRPTVVVKLPPVVREFTVAFDAHCYPRLLAESDPAAEAEAAGE